MSVIVIPIKHYLEVKLIFDYFSIFERQKQKKFNHGPTMNS